MRLHRRLLVTVLVALGASGMIGWSLFQTQAAPARPLDQLVPEGALLYIEAKDFGGLLKDWNGSPEEAQWIKSDDYRVFSNSRLFLRLSKASDEFAKAAGVPPNLKFLNDAAGKESAIAIYNIGNLEFLYVSRMRSGDFLQSALWQSRSRFQPRTAGGKPFFARKDEESGRVVAFATADDYLVLGTREDLVAGALELLSGSKQHALRQAGWYTQALAAVPSAPGDLRMVMNLEKIAVTPHFRTYWVQQNITEMQSYASAVSDLYREGAVYREERVILPKKPSADETELAQSAQAVSNLLALAPKDCGFYQAGATDAKASLAAVEQKIVAPHFGAAPAEKLAPQVRLTGGETGGGSDLETRIDVEPASRTTNENELTGLQKQFETANPKAMLVVQATRKNSDGVLLRTSSVIVIAAASDWDLPSVQKAVQDVVAPSVTASGLGVQWREVKDAGGYFEFDGLSPVQVARRGKLLYFANDATMLAALLQVKGPAPAQPVSYAAGFSHSRERENFYEFSSLVDSGSVSPAAGSSEREPQFFSRNIASFSRTFARIDSEQMVMRQTRDKIQQTVTYRWTQQP
jgi:hypothetical protein